MVVYLPRINYILKEGKRLTLPYTLSTVNSRQQELLWVHESRGTVLSSLLHSNPSELWLLESFYPLFYHNPLRFGREWYAFCAWALHRHLFSAFGQVLSFYINCHSLHKETPLMRFERCMDIETDLEGSITLYPFHKIMGSRFIPEGCVLPTNSSQQIYRTRNRFPHVE